jgi:hypothetical protein
VAHGSLPVTPPPRGFRPRSAPSGGTSAQRPDEKTVVWPAGSRWKRSNLSKMLAGDLIMRALGRLDSSTPLDLDSAPATLEEIDQGGTDPGNIAEFLAIDIPFEVEPATGLILPPPVDRG